MAKTIIAVPPNSLSVESKKELSENDFIVIETEQPDKIKVIDHYGMVEGDTIFMSLIAGLKRSDAAKDEFAREFMTRVMEKEKRMKTIN